MINPSHFNIETELNDACSRWFSSPPQTRTNTYTQTTQIYADAMSENDFSKQGKTQHMAVRPHLVMNVENK